MKACRSWEKIGHKVKGYRNNEEMYKDKDIDAVIISTPDFAHATHTVEAAEHGKHIYVEKPFAETMEDNRRARAAVEKAGVVFQVGSHVAARRITTRRTTTSARANSATS